MSEGLGGKEKLFVYLVGVVIGVVLLSLFSRKEGRDQDPDAPSAIKGIIQSLISTSGIRNLPEGSPEYLRDSELVAWYQSEPDMEAGTFEFIWILGVEDALPWIRVVEAFRFNPADPGAGVEPAGFRLMAADRVVVQPKEGVDRPQLEAELERMGFRLGDRLAGLDGWEVFLGQKEVYSAPKGMARLKGETGWVRDALPYPVPGR